jgi:hypothetical protein
MLLMLRAHMHVTSASHTSTELVARTPFQGARCPTAFKRCPRHGKVFGSHPLQPQLVPVWVPHLMVSTSVDLPVVPVSGSDKGNCCRVGGGPNSRSSYRPLVAVLREGRDHVAI